MVPALIVLLMALCWGKGLLFSNENTFHQKQFDKDHPNKVNIPPNPKDDSFLNKIFTLSFLQDDKREIYILTPDNTTIRAKTA